MTMYTKKIPSIHTESYETGNDYRIAYQNGLDTLIGRLQEESRQRRDDFAKDLAANREHYRAQYCEMLGWPLNAHPSPILRVIRTPVFENDRYEITRMQFELFEGFLFYGILFRHKTDTPLPLVISQHGGSGTPELCSSLVASANYNDMSLRVFNRGVNVFAPQTLLWQADRFGPENKRPDYDKALKQLGGSIAALEIYSIMRCLDYFEQQVYCDRQFAMVGLSYGGFYTLYTTAAEPRIKAALTCNHFNDRIRHNWPDKVWTNSANTFLDAEVGALICPRFLRIETGDQDELFDAAAARAEYERLKTYYAKAPENLEFHIFSGNHEFCPEDTGIEHLLARLNF